MSNLQPKILRGFRDSLPEEEGLRLELIARLQSCFAHSGFQPIDTPALEYSELLLENAGGETEKQVYRFLDQGGRDVSLRFDLTVPFARFVAQYQQQIVLPFKRYHIAKVWRGENTQRGRYREFYQCDFDLVGSSHASADLDVLLTAHRSLQVLGAPCRIAVNHRGLLNQLFNQLEIAPSMRHEAMRLLDKKGKLPLPQLQLQLAQLLGKERSEQLALLLDPSTDLAAMASLLGACPPLEHLSQLLAHAQLLGVNLVFDPSIMRGLDYYTGMVFESFLTQLPELGSVCSGGRYDNLVGRFSSTPLAGVGGSVGLDRLLYGLQQLQLLDLNPRKTQIFISSFDADDYLSCHRLALSLRPYFRCDVYPGCEGKPRTMGAQLQYAKDKGAQLAIIIREKTLQLRRLADRYDYPALVYPQTEAQCASLVAQLTPMLEEAP